MRGHFCRYPSFHKLMVAHHRRRLSETASRAVSNSQVQGSLLISTSLVKDLSTKRRSSPFTAESLGCRNHINVANKEDRLE